MISGTTWLNAPTLRLGIATPTTPLQATKPSSRPTTMASTTPPSVRIAVVGDVHDYWNLEEDRKALQLLKPDLVLFTGDFGNENVDLVRSIANLDMTKAVILGNHDAWGTQKFSAREVRHCMVQSNQHLSFGYAVGDMDESAKRIYQSALGAPEDHSVVLLAHNGPTGLGCNMNDICGKDWVFGGGDNGDPDLAEAISQLKETTKLSIPLVVFGHMHKQLAHGNELRKMIVVGNDNTVYLNGAIVPRVKRLGNEQEMGTRSSLNNETSHRASESGGTSRAFTIAEILDGRVEKVVETWVSVIGEKTRMQEEHIMFSRVPTSYGDTL